MPLKNFVKQVTGKIVPRWDRNVARWCAGCEKHKRIFSADLFQILSDTFTINIDLVST